MKAKVMWTLRFLGGMALGLVFLAMVVAVALAAEPEKAVDSPPPVTSAIVISQCGKTVALILVTADGETHPAPPEEMDDAKLATLLRTVPPGRGLGVIVPCIKGESVI